MNRMIRFLSRFDQVPFQVCLPEGNYLIGEGAPRFSLSLTEEIPLQKLMSSTSLALGEAYMDGNLQIEGNLYETLDYFLAQIEKWSVSRAVRERLARAALSKGKQKRDVRSHYDLGNDFYSLWLDSTMSYSCGYFETEEDSLEQAQVHKTDRILDKIYLREGMELLDIGCGWGFLIIRAAKKYGVRSTGITLSREQYEACCRKVRQEGLEDRVTVELMDYRDLLKYGKQFDRVVSVGMVEHVGRKNYPLFQHTVSQAIRDGGLFLLHFISALKEYPGNDWIRKYIFPGGMIPSFRETASAMAEEQFHILDSENLRPHYVKTLLAWEENFQRQRSAVEEKFDPSFARMWELYLNSCAAAFHNGVIDLHQILAVKGVNNSLPLTRWYDTGAQILR